MRDATLLSVVTMSEVAKTLQYFTANVLSRSVHRETRRRSKCIGTIFRPYLKKHHAVRYGNRAAETYTIHVSFNNPKLAATKTQNAK
jgi:hypothetical protein